MEDTYSTEAIILKRSAFKEFDMKVFLYTKKYGKLELVVKGAKRTKSKIAGHVEPFNLVRVMAVKGRQYDYLGSAINKNAFVNIKNDLEKIALAGKAIKLFNELVKLELADKDLFDFLREFLITLDTKKPNNYKLTYSAFVLKLLKILGYEPDLNICSICKKNIEDFKSFFYNTRGEMICDSCSVNVSKISINQDSIKILKFILNNNFEKIFKLKIDQKNNKEASKFIGSFLQYNI
jgi:DNA repair protein RecO (recombination protein O)